MDLNFLDGTVVTLAHFSAYIATVLTFFSDEGTDTADGHQENFYHHIFASFIPMAYNQVIGRVGMYVEMWYPE